jgi:hypothetical protein
LVAGLLSESALIEPTLCATNEEKVSMADWMGQHQKKRLGEMILPGSHDAGITEKYLDLTIGGSVTNAVTQSLSFRDQLRAGTRFFDLRLSTRGGQVVPQHTTAGLGGYSTRGIDNELAKIDRWCSRHKTEVVIIRVSHTSASTKIDEIITKSCTRSLHKGSGNLCKKKLEDIVKVGGGLVLVLDHEKFGGVINQKKGLHSFAKHKKIPDNPDGLSTCGVYTKTNALHNVIRNGLSGQYIHNTHHSKNDHLWQVYWQKTYLNPLHARGIQGGTRRHELSEKGGKVHGGTQASTDYMIRLMQGHNDVNLPGKGFQYQKQKTKKKWVGLRRKKEITQEKVLYSTEMARRFCLPNIISYDFVNEEVNQLIINLNLSGGQEF